MITIDNVIDFMWKNTSGIIISGFGGFVHYLYKVSRWEKFYFTKLVINILLAGWVWYLCQEMWLSAFFISIAWFSTKTILEFLEERGGKIITDILMNK
jgi:hypothetical protein